LGHRCRRDAARAAAAATDPNGLVALCPDVPAPCRRFGRVRMDRAVIG
jgi:hypothetical protein